MKLLKNLEVISMDSEIDSTPGKKDIIIEGDMIGAVIPSGSFSPVSSDDFKIEVIDCEGLAASPGFIDSHIHLLGGGGEGGPVSRPVGPAISDMIKYGVTSVIGCLGFDGYTRSLSDLFMRTRALKEQGMNAFMYTGAYPLPTPTITGSVLTDILYIDEIIGVGEISISDRRGSPNNYSKLEELAHTVYHANLLTGKGSVINFHLGEHIINPLDILKKLKNDCPINPRHYMPTHINRSESVLKDSIDYIKSGGYGDITCGFPELPLHDVLTKMKNNEVDISRVTLTTDAGGSEPIFDEMGNLTGIDVTRENILYKEIKMCMDNSYSLKEILPLLTSNPANIYMIKNAGTLSPQKRADIILWENGELKDVFMAGKKVVDNKKPLLRERLRETE